MKKFRFISAIVSAALLITSLSACAPAEEPAMRDITTMELVKEMGLGINLGNTLECAGNWINSSTVTNYETAWGSTVITQEIISGYAACGFGVLRVPVAWSNMMVEDYTINAEYMARVKQVVSWALDSGIYVIMNIHWDNGWWEKFPTDKENCMNKYTRIWEQLSEGFAEFDDHLMFESLNEEGGWQEMWNKYSGSDDGKAESFGLLNEINQKFVDVVRASGGNNAKRHLLIAGYNTDFDLTADALFKMPTDPENRMAVSVHYYTPVTFAILDKDASWGKARTTWGNDKDLAELEKYMELMKTTFIDNGIPVIIGEYGVSTKNKTEEMVRLYLTSVCKSAYEHGLCPVLWDIPQLFYDRYTYNFKDAELLSQLMAVKTDAAAANS